MRSRSLSARLALASVVVVAACHDANAPLDPDVPGPAADVTAHAPGQLAAWFNRASPDVLEIPQTVFIDHDESTGQLVIGIENQGIALAVENALAMHGIPTSAYRLRVTPPIVQAATLRDAFRPTMGGIQIHFSMWLCTLGFNVSHAGGRSFITNSHCTDHQGGTEGTQYRQPLSSVNGSVIAVEADDPEYTKCSRGKVCRSSDAARALYNAGTQSTQGSIGRTNGANNGSLEVVGNFTITEQANTATSFSGTVHKIGRTTGWTSGTATLTCVNVNVSGTNIQQQCQTLVENPSTAIVGGGDSGSPVFVPIGPNEIRLLGILWGGSTDNRMFVFSPLKNIQDELGSVTATATGGGGPSNAAPMASFTVVDCSDLSCTFDGSGSSDPDGDDIVSYAWDFGDDNDGAGASVEHTFAGAGTYTVMLTVTDEHGATGDVSQDVTVSSSVAAPITLSATGTKFRGDKTAELSWSGAGSTDVDVYRDGSYVTTTANDGAYTDDIGKGGGSSHTFQVCEAGTSTCSDTVTVNF